MLGYIPDPAERAELAFEARLERYIAEISAATSCTWLEAEAKAIERIEAEEDYGA
jgi:hypothetical protein